MAPLRAAPTLLAALPKEAVTGRLAWLSSAGAAGSVLTGRALFGGAIALPDGPAA